MEVRASRRKRVRLGGEIGGGGEATIYQVVGESGLLAKIYQPSPRPGYDRKLAWMRANPPDDPTRTQGHTSIAWPLDLLYNGQGQFVGYLMHYIRNAVSLLEVFNPRLRAQTLPEFNWRYLHRTARNLAVALGALHTCGYIVGDLNESNVMVTPSAMVTLIDTDSFQVQVQKKDSSLTFFCPVGKPEYTPPELQGRSLGNTRQYPEHDCFGLGVLIFQLLMAGSHPFRAQWLGSGDPPPIEKKISQGAFPYMQSPSLPVEPPRNAPTLDALHPQVAELVQRCFVEGHQHPRWRPTAAEWEKAITEAESALVRCRDGHYYSNHLRACPWCRSKLQAVPAQSTHLPATSGARAASTVSKPSPPPWWRGRNLRAGAANWARGGVLSGAMAGMIVLATAGVIFGALGGAIAGAIGPAAVWALIWAVMWAGGWWAFGEALGETAGGPTLGKVLGVGGAMGGALLGGGLGWGIGAQGTETISDWAIVRVFVNVIAWATGGNASEGVLGQALVGLIGGAFVWGSVWTMAGAVVGAAGWRSVDRHLLAKGLGRVPGKLLGVGWAVAGALEGASAAAIVGVVVGAMVGAMMGLLGGAIGDAPLRAIVGVIVGTTSGAIGGTVGRRYVQGIEQKLARALGIIEALVGLTVGLMVANGGLELWTGSRTGLGAISEGTFIGLVSGALVGLVSGALIGAIGGAIIRAIDV